jgi:hypothetical protein
MQVDQRAPGGLGDALIARKHPNGLVREAETGRGILALARHLEPPEPGLAMQRIHRVHPQEIRLRRIEPAVRKLGLRTSRQGRAVIGPVVARL